MEGSLVAARFLMAAPEVKRVTSTINLRVFMVCFQFAVFLLGVDGRVDVVSTKPTTQPLSSSSLGIIIILNLADE